MDSYFSNSNYESNINSARNEKFHNDIRKAVFKYETKPLKNVKNAQDLVEKEIDPKYNEFKTQLKLHTGINGWFFFYGVVAFHLFTIIKYKKNINELEQPFLHIIKALRAGFTTCLVGTLVYGKTFEAYRNFKNTDKKIVNLKSKFEQYYIQKIEDKENL